MVVTMKSSISEIEAGMNQAAERARSAAANGGSKRFVSNTIVLLKHGQTATLRPVYNMDEAIVFWMHDKYQNFVNGERKSIAAICAEKNSEQSCTHCVDARANKLEANREAFVPVYVSKILDAEGQPVTYKAQDGSMKPVQGFRMLRLKMGSAILAILMSVYKDAEYNNDITGCNFSVSRTDTPGKNGQPPRVSYSCVPKPPTPMNPNVKAGIPALQNFRNALLEVFPEEVLTQSTHAAVIGEIMNSLDAIDASYQAGGSVTVPSSEEEVIDTNF